MKDRSTALAPLASPCTTSPVHLGNCWVVAATIARELLIPEGSARGSPYVVTVNAAGDLEAVAPDHPEYEERLMRPGFVCTANMSMPLERFAGRLRDAAIAAASAQ